MDASDSFGYIFAFQVLPTVIFFSALTALFYYWKILPRIVYAFAWLMKRTLKLSGPESVAAAGNVFLGQTESPLLVKPYLNKMTMSEMLGPHQAEFGETLQKMYDEDSDLDSKVRGGWSWIWSETWRFRPELSTTMD